MLGIGVGGYYGSRSMSIDEILMSRSIEKFAEE